MNNRLKISLIVLIFSIKGFCQPFNNNWLFGESSLPTDTALSAVMIVNFDGQTPIVKKLPATNYIMDLAIATISDSSGKLVLYTNGVHLKNSQHEIVENGDSLPNDNGWMQSFPENQGVLLLPRPGHDKQYILFTADIFGFIYPPTGTFRSGSSNLTYSVIDMGLNNGKGKVIERKTNMVLDTLSGGQLTAVKHANGRDWWIITSRYNINQYYAFLITPEGFTDYGLQSFSSEMRVSLGQAVFSPDGNWYLRYNTVNNPYSSWFDAYRFNRCTGVLSDHKHIQVANEIQRGGVSVSPNSRFAYVAVYDTIYQFDLQATNIGNSKKLVAAYDGFLDNIAEEIGGNVLIPTRFFNMQLAENNKIYITCPDNSSHYLHVIDQPDSLGVACNIIQHGFKLPTLHVFGIPNVPFFGLGALSGSDCDTLTTSLSETIKNKDEIIVFPNPTTGRVSIKSELNLEGISVFDIAGQLLFSDRFPIEKMIDLSNISNGIYFIRLEDKNGVFRTSKVVKTDQ